jgi:signal peptidase I
MSTNLKFEKIADQKEVQRKMNPDLRQELVDYFYYFLKVFLTVTIVYLVVRTSIFDVIGISGKSMFPSYDDRDAIYIDQLTPKFGDYRRGDVIVLIAPDTVGDERTLFIKRVIGLPGERVVLEDGDIFIYSEKYPDGVLLDELMYLTPDVKTYKKVISGNERFEEPKLQEGEYYVLGDNRTGSTDSRFFGKINKSDILGREFYRVLPPEKSGFFELPTYNIEN